MTLGERLKSLIEEKGIDQKRFAELFNLSPTTVSGYVTNYRTPNDELKKKFADFFCVSIDYLLGHTDKRNITDKEKETKTFHNLDINGLPDEAIKQIEDYIEFVRQKYDSDGKLEK